MTTDVETALASLWQKRMINSMQSILTRSLQEIGMYGWTFEAPSRGQKVLARIGNWSIRHGQHLKRHIVDIKSKKPSGCKIRNKLAPIITNRSIGCEHKRRYPKAARISGNDQEVRGRRELNQPCADRVKRTEDEVDV